MKILIKITAAIAAIIGFMAVVTGSRVLLGSFDPGYQYFISLVTYNVLMGAFSIYVGILIWQMHKKALLYSVIISGFHIIVLLLLLTIFRDVISTSSIGAMSFRSIAWSVFSLIIWKGSSKKI